MKLKLLYDCQIFSNQQYGGVSRIFYELIRHFVHTENVEVNLFHGFYINRYPLADLKNQFASYRGRRIVYFPHVSVILKTLNHFLFKQYAMGKQIHVYHPTNFSSHAAKWKKSPMVATVCDVIPELFPDDFPDIVRRLKVKKECIMRADHIIAISERTKKDIMAHYAIPETRISAIYPGSPELTHSTADSRFPAFPHPRPFILFVGTRKQPYKNFLRLLSVYASSTIIHCAFDLVCFGGLPFGKTEARKIADAGVMKRVYHYAGSDAFLEALYKTANAFIYPSLYEGFGLPPLEAMANGCPVITSRIAAIPEVLGDAAVYFDPASSHSIQTTLEQTLFDSEKKQQLQTRGYEQVKKFSWSETAAKTLNAYFFTVGAPLET